MNSRITFQLSRKETRESPNGYIPVGYSQDVIFLSTAHLELITAALREHGNHDLANEITARILMGRGK